MKVALVYDRVNKWGGAERLLLALKQLFPDAPLFTSVYNKSKAPWADVYKVNPSFLQQFPFALSTHELYAPFMPLAFESFNFDAYDIVISVTSEAAKGVITKPSTLHICYCLTPTRYLWSGYEEYFQNRAFRLLSQPFITYLKLWDLIAAKRPDAYIAISKEVQSRIKKYYNRESEVVYPPVAIQNSELRIQNSDTNLKTLPTTYFLVVSRLVPYKRIDIAIQACNMLQLPLVVVGSGSQKLYLRRIAGRTINFAGNLTDDELTRYYKKCTALIITGNEDFGLTPLEANSFGKPVIAYKKGGLAETVINGKTGVFFNDQTVDSLVDALKKFQTMKISSKDCQKNAERFSQKKFKEEFMKQINSISKSFW